MGSCQRQLISGVRTNVASRGCQALGYRILITAQIILNYLSANKTLVISPKHYSEFVRASSAPLTGPQEKYYIQIELHALGLPQISTIFLHLLLLFYCLNEIMYVVNFYAPFFSGT